jgi:hypothetical protein
MDSEAWRSLSRQVLPSLDILSLNGNPLSGIELATFEFDKPAEPGAGKEGISVANGDCCCNASTLFLSDTQIGSWHTVDVALHAPYFRSVVETSCRRWPLFDADASSGGIPKGEAQGKDANDHASVAGSSDLDRRHMLVARLPKTILTLNGTVMTGEERDDADRYFIRYCDAVGPEVLALSSCGQEASRLYEALVVRHGHVAPLACVDMGRGCVVSVSVMNFKSGKMVSVDFDSVGCSMEKLFKICADAVGPFTSKQAALDVYLVRASQFGSSEALHATIASSESPSDWVSSATVEPSERQSTQMRGLTWQRPEKFGFLALLCSAERPREKWVIGVKQLRVAMVQTGDVLVMNSGDRCLVVNS